MEGFEAELEKQRERARQSWKGDEGGVSPLFQHLSKRWNTVPWYQAVRSDQPRCHGYHQRGNELVDSIEGSRRRSGNRSERNAFLRRIRRTGRRYGNVHVAPDGVAWSSDTYSPLRGVIVHKVEMDFGKLSSATKSRRR